MIYVGNHMHILHPVFSTISQYITRYLVFGI